MDGKQAFAFGAFMGALIGIAFLIGCIGEMIHRDIDHQSQALSKLVDRTACHCQQGKPGHAPGDTSEVSDAP